MSKKPRRPRSLSPIFGFLAGVLVVMGFVGYVLARDRKPVQKPMDESSVPRISVAEAQKKIAAGEVTVIDVRDINGYLDAHIPGSMHIPLARIDGEINYLPRNKPIITYCTCPAEESSAQAGLILRMNGFDASCLVGGLGAWKNAGLATHSGETP